MGQKRWCESYRATTAHNRRDGKSHKVLRCESMTTNPNKKAHPPACDTRLRDGGRSKGLMRPGPCPRPKRGGSSRSGGKHRRNPATARPARKNASKAKKSTRSRRRS